jgi:hypothetical protein
LLFAWAEDRESVDHYTAIMGDPWPLKIAIPFGVFVILNTQWNHPLHDFHKKPEN